MVRAFGFNRSGDFMDWRVISLGCILAAGLAVGAEPGQTLNATLSGSSGDDVQLSDQLGKPLVLFYEDRDSNTQNQALKDELYRLGKERNLLDAVRVVAVANLKSWDWRPARDFALAGVRSAESKFNIPIYIDFKGTLSAPPWGLPPKASSVLVLDEAGKVLFVASGPLTKAEREQIYAVLEGLLAKSGAVTARE
jgi:hypothetical protein